MKTRRTDNQLEITTVNRWVVALFVVLVNLFLVLAVRLSLSFLSGMEGHSSRLEVYAVLAFLGLCAIPLWVLARAPFRKSVFFLLKHHVVLIEQYSLVGRRCREIPFCECSEIERNVRYELLGQPDSYLLVLKDGDAVSFAQVNTRRKPEFDFVWEWFKDKWAPALEKLESPGYGQQEQGEEDVLLRRPGYAGD